MKHLGKSDSQCSLHILDFFYDNICLLEIIEENMLKIK